MTKKQRLYGDMAAVLESLPNALRYERAAKGLSYRQAGAQIGISYTALRRYETRDSHPNAHQLLLILRWLDAGATAPTAPEQPPIGGFCDSCGHFAGRHAQEGCQGYKDKPCKCSAMQWLGYRWPRPWLAAPEGLLSE